MSRLVVPRRAPVVAPASLVIEGRPASKKNSLDFVRRGKEIVPIQSAKYRAWQASALVQLQVQWRGAPAIDYPLAVSAWFYEHPMQRFDLAGAFQALCDVLQEAKVIKNDRLVRVARELVIRRDRARPRIELTWARLAPEEV